MNLRIEQDKRKKAQLEKEYELASQGIPIQKGLYENLRKNKGEAINLETPMNQKNESSYNPFSSPAYSTLKF